MNTPSSSEKRRRSQYLFEAALDLNPEERKTFLDRECGGDRDMRKELEELLGEAQPVFDELEELEQNLILPALGYLRKNPEKLNVWMDSVREADRVADTLIGKTISHYEIRELIGRGGMGMVYRAHDRSLGREVALKFLPPTFGTDIAAKERFIQEAKSASALDHPNIAAVHETGETDDGQLFIAMGYYPGDTLKSIIEKGPIPVDQALDIAIQIADALKEAHDHGIIHRDIKPGNFIMNENGVVHLLDFGLAKLSHASGYTQIGLMMGTVAYMSPEQARGEEVDAATDIWSLGAVLYEMLTGQRPFGKGDAPSAIHAILHEDPVSPEIADGKTAGLVRDILGKCLQKDPKNRYQSAGALLEDLDRARGGMPLKKRLRLMAWKGQRRRRRMAIIGSGVALAVVVVSLIPILLEKPVEMEMVDLGPESDPTILVLKKLAGADPVDINACISLGNIYADSRGAFDEAMIWFRKAHTLDAENPDITLKIADIYALLGDEPAARWWMDRVLAVAPDAQIPDDVKIRAYLGKGNLNKAKEFVRPMDHARQTFDESSHNLFLRTLLRSGDAPAAMAFCEEYCGDYLELPAVSRDAASLKVVEDPIRMDSNKVLAFDPGTPLDQRREEAVIPAGLSAGTASETGSFTYKAALALPPEAWIEDEPSGKNKTTLYFRIARPAIDGRAGTCHVVWGLAEGAALRGMDFLYRDFSIQSRIEADGILGVRNGQGYQDLADTPMDPDVYYALWYVIDHSVNTFDLYICGGSQFPEQTKVIAGAKYRRETNGPLDHLVMITRGGVSTDGLTALHPTYFDDFYMRREDTFLETPDASWVCINDFENGIGTNWMAQLHPPDQVLDPSHAESAWLVARTLQANGRDAEARTILDLLQASLESSPNPLKGEIQLMLARIHASRGQFDSARKILVGLLESGKYGWWLKELSQADWFASIQEDAALRTLFESAITTRDKQYRRIQEMDGRGEFGILPRLVYMPTNPNQAHFAQVSGCDLVQDKGHFFASSWGDYDSDGDLDVVLASLNPDAALMVYRNDGPDRFNRVDLGVVTSGVLAPAAPAWIDLDNDDDLDLFVTTRDNGKSRFFRNDGIAIFTEVMEGEWLNMPEDSSGSFWGDYDNDGLLDLFLSNYGPPNRLYHNKGNGKMETVPWDEAGGYSNGAAFADYDNDGDLDLFVTGKQRIQYRNEGNGVFTWIAPADGGLPGFSGMETGFAFADYDNDGDLDTVYMRDSGDVYNVLYRNDGEKGFNQAYALPSSGMDCNLIIAAWGDYDNDGHEDLLITTLGQANHLYHNEGDGTFLRETETPIVSTSRHSWIAEWMDYDNDGDLDLFIPNGAGSGILQTCELFRNEGNGNNWIQLELTGVVSNHQAIGAKVYCTATIEGRELTQMRVNHTRSHFGLGDAGVVDSLVIEWPSGIVQELKNVVVNQLLSISEPDR